jgi:hypothetical protein
MIDVVRVQIHHDRLDDSNPYPAPIEAAIIDLESKGLEERGWDSKDDPGIIRHETGAEIIVLVAALAELSAAILHLIAASKNHRPETKVSITVNSPTDISKVLTALSRD